MPGLQRYVSAGYISGYPQSCSIERYIEHWEQDNLSTIALSYSRLTLPRHGSRNLECWRRHSVYSWLPMPWFHDDCNGCMNFNTEQGLKQTCSCRHWDSRDYGLATVMCPRLSKLHLWRSLKKMMVWGYVWPASFRWRQMNSLKLETIKLYAESWSMTFGLTAQELFHVGP